MSTSTAVQQKPQGYVISPLNGRKAQTEKSTSAMPFEEALNRAAESGKDQDAGRKKDASARDADKTAAQNTTGKSEQEARTNKDTAKSDPSKEDTSKKTETDGKTADTSKQKDSKSDAGAEAAVNLQAMLAMTETAPVFQTEDINAALEQLAEGKAEPQTEAVSSADQSLMQAENLNRNQETQSPLTTDEGQAAGREETVSSFQAMWQNSRKEIHSQAENTSDQIRTGPAEAKNMVMTEPEENRTADSETDTDSGFTDMMSAQAKLAKAVKEAGSGEETPTETVDLEKLKKDAEEKGLNLMDRLTQARINGSGTIHTADKAGEATATPVLNQLRTGLEQGIKDNLSEFTIKLKPEGLGEIVVHMASAGGKLTVDIGATSQETQKLINSQMAALKEMLEPLHAEVGSVSHSSQNAMEFLDFGQNQYQDQRQQTFGSHRNHRTVELLDDDFMEQADRMIAESIPGRLYAYV